MKGKASQTVQSEFVDSLEKERAPAQYHDSMSAEFSTQIQVDKSFSFVVESLV